MSAAARIEKFILENVGPTADWPIQVVMTCPETHARAMVLWGEFTAEIDAARGPLNRWQGGTTDQERTAHLHD